MGDAMAGRKQQHLLAYSAPPPRVGSGRAGGRPTQASCIANAQDRGTSLRGQQTTRLQREKSRDDMMPKANSRRLDKDEKNVLLHLLQAPKLTNCDIAR